MALSVSISYSLLTETRLGINFLDHGLSDLACGFLSPGPSLPPSLTMGQRITLVGKTKREAQRLLENTCDPQ